MKQEESFGVIPLKKEKGAWKVLLIQHRKGRYWGFPKGHAEEGESPKEAAFRELLEETNLKLAKPLQEEPLSEKYIFQKAGQKVEKTVLYFIAEVEGDVKLQENEIYAAQWVFFPECFDTVTHKEGKEILSRVAKILKIL